MLTRCLVCSDPATYGNDKSEHFALRLFDPQLFDPRIEYCERHALKNMVNLCLPTCKCGKEARYRDESDGTTHSENNTERGNTKRSSILVYCKDCKPNYSKRVSYITCRLCGSKATHGINKYIPQYCNIHAPSYTIPCKLRQCKKCDRIARYGKSGEKKPTFCRQHKGSGYTFLSSRNTCYCLRRASYGPYASGRTLFCVAHVPLGMCYYTIRGELACP